MNLYSVRLFWRKAGAIGAHGTESGTLAVEAETPEDARIEAITNAYLIYGNAIEHVLPRDVKLVRENV